MRYLVLINDQEVEYPDEISVKEDFLKGKLGLETWVKPETEEAGWEFLEEMLPKWKDKTSFH